MSESATSAGLVGPYRGESDRPKTAVEEQIPFASLVDMLRQRAQERPDALARIWLVDGENEERRWTYGELDEQARAVAVALRELTEPGERALLLYAPCLEYLAAFMGCLYAGVVAVPAYPPDPSRLRVTLPRVQAIVRDSDAAVALTTSDILPMVENLFVGQEGIREVKWLASDAVDLGAAQRWEDPGRTWSDLAFLQYTSGSTASPKGVMVSHGNLLHNMAVPSQMMARYGFPIENYVSWLPVYHDMGLIGGLLQSIYEGNFGISMSPMAFLQRPLRWLQAISKYRGKVSPFPNFALDLCVRKVTEEQRDQLDLSSWKMACNGAEPIRAQTFERFKEYFAPAGFDPKAHAPGYGLAENTLTMTLTPPDREHTVLEVSAKGLEDHKVVSPESEEDTRRVVGCGIPMDDHTILIVEPETCKTLAEGGVGEIWVASPSNAHGYWNNPELSSYTFAAYTSDTNLGPFLRTGDLGFMHDGELFVTGRQKDMIIVDGANYYPQDIEQTVEKAHPLIREGCVAAFSVDDDGQGKERLVVVAEANVKPGEEFDAEGATSAIRAAVSLAHSLRLHDIAYIQPRSIHKTSSGKLQRHANKNAYVGKTLELIGV